MFPGVATTDVPCVVKESGCVKQLVEDIAKALVDIPEAVSVKVVEGEHVTVLEGKVIGRQGRTAEAIRKILSAAGMKLNRRFKLEILE